MMYGRPTVFLEVNPDFVGLGAGDFCPSLSWLLLCPRRDVTPVEPPVGELDASQAKPKL